jgi:hypothetical protein
LEDVCALMVSGRNVCLRYSDVNVSVPRRMRACMVGEFVLERFDYKLWLVRMSTGICNELYIRCETLKASVTLYRGTCYSVSAILSLHAVQ